MQGVGSVLVRARGLTKTFGEGHAQARVLDGAGLEVARGEFIAVVGKSGSGKSTLLHLLGGLDRADSGEIEVDGVRIDRLDERGLTAIRRHKIGFVFQTFHLLPELTGAENVLLPARLARDGVEAAPRAEELLERLGFARLRSDRARTALVMAGVMAAAAMVGAAVTVAYALGTAFDRSAAAAAMPDVTAQFAQQPLAPVATRVRALANVRAAAYRIEAKGVDLTAGPRFATAVVDGVRNDGPRGYALTSGRDIRLRDEVVIEEGLARSWHVHLADRLTLGGEPLGVVGLATTPGTVAYPLSRSPRLYVSYDTARRLTGGAAGVNDVLLWLTDPSQVDVTLAQARAASFGLQDLQLVSRVGYRHLHARDAGHVK